jgi:hypothetical protein
LAQFSPLVEVGAGKGYWASLLREREGVDISAYDAFIDSERCDDYWTTVQHGDSNVLLKPEFASGTHNLFLCYPDEQTSMAIACLERFQGEYVVHVGELMQTGTLMGRALPVPLAARRVRSSKPR